jgi:hypothetical protein
LAKARFDNQLMKTNKALLDFAGQVAEDDLLPTRLPDKVKKLKWAKPRKSHGKASARSFTGAEAAEIAANQAEQSNKVARTPREDIPGGGDGEIMVPATPPRRKVSGAQLRNATSARSNFGLSFALTHIVAKSGESHP